MANERMQASEFRADLREALNRVEYNGVHIEIHRRNKVAGVLLPWTDYLRLLDGRLPGQADQREDQLSSSHDDLDSLDTSTITHPPQRSRDDWMQWNK